MTMSAHEPADRPADARVEIVPAARHVLALKSLRFVARLLRT